MEAPEKMNYSTSVFWDITMQVNLDPTVNKEDVDDEVLARASRLMLTDSKLKIDEVNFSEIRNLLRMFGESPEKI